MFSVRFCTWKGWAISIICDQIKAFGSSTEHEMRFKSCFTHLQSYRIFLYTYLYIFFLVQIPVWFFTLPHIEVIFLRWIPYFSFHFFLRLNWCFQFIYMCTVHTSSFAHDLFKMYRPDFPAMHNESLVEIYGKYLPNFRYRWLADIIPTHHKLLASSGMTFNNIFYIQKLRVLFNRHFIQQQTLFLSLSLCV